ncbi:MAG: enoyl-CoA hydratase-related protein [Dehalococcoidia bacterium]|nr:enoyl-CoA hydratase-related protein [Dehalococcoidia bacterium]
MSAIRPGDEALDEAQRLAKVMAERGPLAIQLAKEAIWRGIAMPLEQALRFETDLTLLLQTTNDRAEGVAAFVEKRPPRFTGT